MALPGGIGGIALIGGGSLAVVGSIFALWTGYVHTLGSISQTDGEVVPEAVATPPVPDGFQDEVDRITKGYEGAYFDPIEQAGNQVNDPNAPDPTVVLPEKPPEPRR